MLFLLLACTASGPARAPAEGCRDLDCDGWPDLVLARTQDESGSYDTPSVVLFGGPDGWRSQELPTRGAMGAAIGDLDQDGFPEVILAQATSDGEQRHVDSLVFHGSADGPDPQDPLGLPTIGAADVKAVDLDQDGHLDLIFSNRYGGGEVTEAAYTQESRIYWGSPTGPDPAVSTGLVTLGAAEAAVADFDGDGRLDLAFAAGTLFASESPLFRATGARTFEAWRTLPTIFAEGVRAGDADLDGHPDLLFSNWCGGTECDSVLYRGGPDGPQATEAIALPTLGGVDGHIVDLDQDGHPDLLFANSFDLGFDPEVDSYVYWGGDTGWSEADRSRLASPGASSVGVADLDRDGLLDLVFPGYYGLDGVPPAATIWWGDALDGSPSQIAVSGAAAVAIAGGLLPPPPGR